ncbi:hypothetical protein HYV84_05140 [Candidatus Woesearchaeota archaeon]|nr:hypothetical protein [Candidatus Woesearchaeota archaeon]
MADNPFSCAGNSYSTQINLDGGDGFKFIEVRARDKAGNTNTAAKLITLDTVVPEIIITDIANNPQLILGRMPLQTSIESVTLRGMVRDDNLATLSVLQNNVSVPKVSLRAQQGTVQSVFEANISLAGIPGEERVNTIEIIAVDTFGQIGKQSLNITKDLAGPNITSFVPPTFSVHDAQPILSLATHETSEKCSLTYPLQVTSGVKTEEFISNDKRSFFVALSTPIRNIAGSTSAQSISINCTDSLGNTATHLRTLQVDFEDPQVASFDIDYFEKTFVQGNVDSKTFLITKIPAGAGLRLSAETNEDAQCAFKEGSAIIPFASDGVSDTGLFVRAHQTGIIPIDDITNRSFLIGCRDKSGRLSLQKEIKLIINSVVGLDAPLIILQNPPYSSLGIAAAAFSNRTVVFEGSITSLTLGVQIDAAQLAIAGTTSSIPLEVNGHFQKTVGPLPSDGIFNFTVFANNTRGNKTFLKGAVSIDTEGPGGCVTINNARSCSAIGQAKILAQQLASASVSSPSSGPIPVCGDNICSFREHCFIDCLVTDIPIFSAAGEMVNPDGTILFSGVYEDNQTNVFFAKVLVANTSSLILQELNSTLVSEHLVSKVNVLNQPAFFNGKNAVWQARQGNNHYLIFIYSEDSQSDIPSLILQRYFSKYPSVLT